MHVVFKAKLSTMEGGPAGMAGHARLSFVPAPLPPPQTLRGQNSVQTVDWSMVVSVYGVHRRCAVTAAVLHSTSHVTTN